MYHTGLCDASVVLAAIAVVFVGADSHFWFEKNNHLQLATEALLGRREGTSNQEFHQKAEMEEANKMMSRA